MVDSRPRATYGIGRPTPPWSKGSGFGLIIKGRSDIILKPGPTRGSFTVYPYQVGIIIADGILEYVFEEEKRNLPKGEVRTYVVSTAPFRLLFRLKLPWEASQPEDIVLDPPLTTSDAQHVAGRIDLTVSVMTQGSVFTSVMPEGAHRLFQLLGLDGDVITKSDVVDVIKGELWPKLLALDLLAYAADELRNNQEPLRDISNSLKTELASAIDRFGLQLDDFYVSWVPSPHKAAPIKQPEPDSRLEDPKPRRGSQTSAPAKSTPKQTHAQDSQSSRGSRSSPARRQPVSKRKTNKPTVEMSAMQQLRNSGLFDEGKPQENGSVHFQVKGKYGATIYVTGNEREIQIRDGALQKNRFPNNKRLYEFVRSRAHGTARSKGNSAYAYRLNREHIAKVIEVIRSGL